MKFTYLIKIVVIGIILLPIIGHTKLGEEYDLTYIVKYLGSNEANCFDIYAQIKGNAAGRLLLKTPGYVSNVNFSAKKGNLSYADQGNNIFLFSLEPNVNLESNYRACVSHSHRDNIRPMIEDGLFHFISETLFVLPNDDLDEIKNVKIQFIGFPDNYSILTNHVINKRNYETKASIRTLSRSIMAGGKFDIKTVSINNKPVHIALNGHWTMFNHDELVKDLKKIIQAQRDFLEDSNFPHFVIFILDDKLSMRGISGSLYENTLSMIVSDGDIKYKPILLGTFSHELFHAWIGNKIRVPMPQGNMQWFIEGVNDFYGWQLALDAGLISTDDYIKYYNKILEKYMLSPFKEAANDEIYKSYQHNNLANDLALVRGHIVFMEVLQKLKKRNKTRASIDAALKEIVDKYSDKKLAMTEEDLEIIFNKNIGDDIWKEAVEVIKNGKHISFSPHMFSNQAKLNIKEFDVPNYGFDLKALVQSHIIHSLATKSSAYQAGLRENAHIVEYGLDITNPKGLAYLVVEESKENKLIKFSPNITKKKIPQYERV